MGAQMAELDGSTRAIAEDRLKLLPTPLPALPMQICLPDQVADQINACLSCAQSRSADGRRPGLSMLGRLQLADIQLIASKTTPLQVIQAENERFCAAICFAGSLLYRQHSCRAQATAGDVLIVPNQGGQLTLDDCSAILFEFVPRRLQRTLAAITGDGDAFSPQHQQTLIISSGSLPQQGRPVGSIFEYFDFVNAMLQEDEAIPDVLGMDELLFRLLALEWMRTRGQLDTLRRRRRDPLRGAVLDQLVDFILANLDRPITLTDLEEQSHYSGRQLQYLFRRKFNCTPIQFVRRQRLKSAMTRIERACIDDTIAAIAREFGYRNTGAFSSDFHRQFAVHPSVVLREARHRNGQGSVSGNGHGSDSGNGHGSVSGNGHGAAPGSGLDTPGPSLTGARQHDQRPT